LGIFKFNLEIVFMRTNTIVFCLVLGFILLLSGCKKKKLVYVVEGVVTNQSFNQPFASLTLKVEIKKAVNAFYSTTTTVTTNSKGYYRFELENDLIEKIRISAEPDLYFPIEQIIPYGNLSTETNVYNLNGYAKSWARLIFNNINPNSSDHLSYIKKDGKVNCPECCTSAAQDFYGATNDTVICINNGNTLYSYNYNLVGTPTYGFVSIYTAAFDTSEVILNY